MPLKDPFYTHLQTVSNREGIIVEVIDEEGYKGYGEAVAFSTPWYTEETVQTCLHMLTDILIPIIKKTKISHPEEVSHLFAPIRRNQMAKASIETAIWDLYGKQQGKSLASLLGDHNSTIPAGAVVASSSISGAINQIEHFIELGYERIKIKINPPTDIEWISEIRKHFPELPLMADANSAYTLQDMDRLKALDEFQLLMIEQPFAHDDFLEHAKLQSELKTPLCLDESIHSISDVRKAIELNSCGVINIKIGRVGGLQNAKEIYELCLKHHIKVWVGGMIEFGVSKAHNIALASLPGFQIPGDIASSSRYWEEDIITPEIQIENGKIIVPNGPGIGYQMNEKRLNKVLIDKRSFPMGKI